MVKKHEILLGGLAADIVMLPGLVHVVPVNNFGAVESPVDHLAPRVSIIALLFWGWCGHISFPHANMPRIGVLREEALEKGAPSPGQTHNKHGLLDRVILEDPGILLHEADRGILGHQGTHEEVLQQEPPNSRHFPGVLSESNVVEKEFETLMGVILVRHELGPRALAHHVSNVGVLAPEHSPARKAVHPPPNLIDFGEEPVDFACGEDPGDLFLWAKMTEHGEGKGKGNVAVDATPKENIDAGEGTDPKTISSLLRPRMSGVTSSTKAKAAKGLTASSSISTSCFSAPWMFRPAGAAPEPTICLTPDLRRPYGSLMTEKGVGRVSVTQSIAQKAIPRRVDYTQTREREWRG